MVICRLQRARQNLAANVVVAYVTALGQLRGNSDHAKPVRSEHVGVFFDVKRSGEATHKPHLRIAPLQRGEASFEPLFEAARARFTPQLPWGETAPDGLATSTSCSTGGWPTRSHPAQSLSKQGQGFHVAHCDERCEQRGLQARARALCGQHPVDGGPVDRQPKPDHSATGKF